MPSMIHHGFSTLARGFWVTMARRSPSNTSAWLKWNLPFAVPDTYDFGKEMSQKYTDNLKL